MAVEFVSSIRALGGDFTSASAWMDSYAPASSFLNLTDPVRIVRVFNITGTDTLQTNELVTSSSGGQAEIRGRVAASQIVLRILSGSFNSGDIITSPSGSLTLASNPEQAILVCEFYGDWSNGLEDSISLRIFGNTSSYPEFRVEDSARHRGRVKATPGLFYLAPASGAGFTDQSFAKGHAVLRDIAVDSATGVGFNVASNKTFINPLVYGADNGVASFSDIGPNTLIVNGQSTAGSPVGYQIRPGTGSNTKLVNCSDWNSLTSFMLADIIGTTDAQITNCAGLSAGAGLACFIGTFTHALNLNNASRDSSAPGANSSLNATPTLENEALFLKHLSVNDTALNGRGSNLTGQEFDFDYDYELRPLSGPWAIGPDEPTPDYRAIGYAVLQDTGDIVFALGATWNSGHAVLLDTQTDMVTGEGLVNSTRGRMAAYAVANNAEFFPLGKPQHDEMFGAGFIVGDGQAVLVDGNDLVHGIGKVGAKGTGQLVDTFDITSFAGGQGILVDRHVDQLYGLGFAELDLINSIGFLGMMVYRGDLSSLGGSGPVAPLIPDHGLELPSGTANKITAEHPHAIFTNEQADWLQRKLVKPPED